MHPYIHTSIHTSIHPYIHTYIHTSMHTSVHPSIHYITLHYITSHHITSHHITLHYIHIHSYLDIYILYRYKHIGVCCSIWNASVICWLESDLWNTCFTCLFIHPPKMGDPFYMTIISRHRSLTGTPKDRSKTAWLEVSSKTRVEGSPESRWESCLEACAQIGALLAYHGTKWWLWMVKRFMGPAFSSMVFTKTGVVI